ncbi:DUF402 domain-containing protein [Alkalibacillus sp. S2W]|uniref:nucleoside tri-diphosphate phosphatase n=1 Tax=Alkalibacillus TaxID=331654 RepID=UPI001420C0DD|nr:DUF402 domain-containing protein [Alkalibacillus almallahensis]NIK11574.1 hypothetical protein [Alkalibacillus almallahensis]
MMIPEDGDEIEIRSYKHNGSLHRVWEKTIVLHSDETTLIGGNDRVKVTESDGRTWRTREPAITYFTTDYWFNIISMMRQDGIYYYCNISSPYVVDHEALKYIDYDLDIKVFADGSYKILDEDEYDIHRKKMNYPDVLQQILYKQLQILEQWVQGRKGPFDAAFVEKWYDYYRRNYK